jgi:hypothetical protein
MGGFKLFRMEDREKKVVCFPSVGSFDECEYTGIRVCWYRQRTVWEIKRLLFLLVVYAKCRTDKGGGKRMSGEEETKEGREQIEVEVGSCVDACWLNSGGSFGWEGEGGGEVEERVGITWVEGVGGGSGFGEKEGREKKNCVWLDGRQF